MEEKTKALNEIKSAIERDLGSKVDKTVGELTVEEILEQIKGHAEGYLSDADWKHIPLLKEIDLITNPGLVMKIGERGFHKSYELTEKGRRFYSELRGKISK